MDIQLKIKTESDSGFFMELFGEIKSSELHLNAWPEQVKHQLVIMQYNAFEKSVMTEYPDYMDFVVLYNSEKAGRLQLDKNDNDIRIINISLLPDYRNLGIGSALIREIISEANTQSKTVSLEVDKINPATNLYSKLGFKIFGENELKYAMKYQGLTNVTAT